MSNHFFYFTLFSNYLSTLNCLRPKIASTARSYNGKKRSISQLGRWSSDHNWQGRVAVYDAEVARAAYREQLAQRQSEVLAFINEDMAISLKFQKLCKAQLEVLIKAGDNIDRN